MLLATLAAAVLGSLSPIQSPTAPTFSTAPATPLSYGTYDFEQGFQRSLPPPRSPGPDVLHSTIHCPAYYYGYMFSPAIKQEWVDEFGLPSRGVGGVETINEFSWAYCATSVVGSFDAVLSIYEDTTPGVGPSVWVPGQPSFADCTYLISGLPDAGCWSVTVDLTGGAECTVPQTGAPGAAYVGWSVTPITHFSGGPLFVTQSCAGYGTVDSFEWRDWSGAYSGVPYTYRGSFGGGGGALLRADFLSEARGTPEDVLPCYGTAALDLLSLSAVDNAEPGSVFELELEDAPAGSAQYALLVAHGACVGAPAVSSFGPWTRQVALPLATSRIFTASGPSFRMPLPIPPGAPPNARASVQVVELNGPAAASSVQRASNGLEFYL